RTFFANAKIFVSPIASSENSSNPALPRINITARLKGKLNLAPYELAGCCLSASGSHRRCTGPSAVRQMTSRISSGVGEYLFLILRAQSMYGCEIEPQG